MAAKIPTADGPAYLLSTNRGTFAYRESIIMAIPSGRARTHKLIKVVLFQRGRSTHLTKFHGLVQSAPEAIVVTDRMSYPTNVRSWPPAILVTAQNKLWVA